MSRNIFVIPLLFLSLISFQSNGEAFDDLVERKGLFYKKFTDTPFTGKVTGKTQGVITNGRRNGPWVIAHRTVLTVSKGDYKDGRKEGVWDYFYNGGLIQKWIFKKGLKEGPALTYGYSGELSEKGDYKNDKRDGTWETYLNSGQLFQKHDWTNGKLNGLTLSYRILDYFHTQGTIRMTAMMVFGLIMIPMASYTAKNIQGWRTRRLNDWIPSKRTALV